MEIVLIAAMSSNRVIGNNNAIPWHIPEELQYFKRTTMGFPLIMGRKTHEAIGSALPGRKNIVITRNKEIKYKGCLVVHSIDEALEASGDARRVFILGGENIFRQTIKIANTILLTVLDRDLDGDTFFPEFSSEDFIQINSTRIEKTEPFTIYTFIRKT